MQRQKVLQRPDPGAVLTPRTVTTCAAART
jgi:hypothetical protein